MLVSLAIGGSIVLLANVLGTQRRTNDEIREHFQNVAALRHTQALLVDAETGQRGFLLTSDRSFLVPYQQARGQLPDELARLARAGIDGPGQPLESAARAKLSELALTVQLAESGRRDDALARIRTGIGKRYMDEYRAETSRLVAIQQAQLNSAIRRAEGSSVRTYWALGFLLISAVAVLLFGGALLLRTRRLEAEAVRLREVERAERRTALIARELNHRVKNLFSVVLAIIQLASRGSKSPQEAVSRIRERVEALARAHEVSLGDDPTRGFDLESVLRAILAPYISTEAELEIKGPKTELPIMRVTPIGLIVHELATNAVKYGAWSDEAGKVGVRWSVDEAESMNGTPALRMLRLHWDEIRQNPLPEDGTAGFGSRLINAAVAQLDGSITRERGDHGLKISIDAPIIPDDTGPGGMHDR